MELDFIRKVVQDYEKKQSGCKLNPKAVLFDMDGVLYDSMRFHARAWKEVADAHSLLSSEDDFYLYEGRTGSSTIDELYMRTFQRKATDEEKQAIDVLEKVAAAGLQRLVVTGSGQKSLIDKLEHTYPHCFTPDKMVTAFDVKYGKPDPEPYLMGLVKAGVSAHEAFVVENAPLGVRAGVAAGIFTIAVNTGPLADEVLWNEGANLLFPSMESLAVHWPLLMQAVGK